MLHYKNTPIDFRGQSIYIGIDVHKKSWQVSIYTKDFEHKTFSSPPQTEAVISYLRRTFPGGSYFCVYEAGYSGYWIRQKFEQEGVNCIIVNPADIPIKDKEKRIKNDRVDSRKLARSLRSGDLEGIYIPSEQKIEDRSLMRMRHLTVRKLTRTKNQIKAYISFYGLVPGVKPNWSNKFIGWLETIKFCYSNGNMALKILLDEYKYQKQVISDLNNQIRLLSQTDSYREDVNNLITIPGISTLSAMIILTEIDNINRFKGLDQLNSYVGLIPGEYSSGENEHTTGIVHRGNTLLRRILVEVSWIAVKKDPSLLMAFNTYSKTMAKNKAIIKIARKVLNRIRFILLNKQNYVTGVV